MAKLTTPITVAFGSKCATNSGIEANNSKGPFPFVETEVCKKTGICFPMMIKPMAANIP